MLLRQRPFQDFERSHRVVCRVEQLEILGIYHAVTHERVEAQDLAPVLGAVKDHGDPLVELADMREAHRSYEANLQVVRQAREMIGDLIDLLKGR